VSIGFSKTPVYFTSLAGLSSHWNIVGATSVYLATPKGFRVYVRWADEKPLTIVKASQSGWYIQWVGIED